MTDGSLQMLVGTKTKKLICHTQNRWLYGVLYYIPEHLLVTSVPSLSKNRALQPPQKSDTQSALGTAGH